MLFLFNRSIMKGGAVALDGRIDPGDMILQANQISCCQSKYLSL